MSSHWHSDEAGVEMVVILAAYLAAYWLLR